MQLSILIPTYCQTCVPLVRELHRQATNLPDLVFEIIVSDDATPSTHSSLNENKTIDTLPHSRLIVQQRNLGRSANRNFLAREAKYEHLLFIDSHMSIAKPDFLATYAKLLKGDMVVYGGYDIPPLHDKALCHNLRARYEQHCRRQMHIGRRNMLPYQNLHTANVLIPRAVLLALPFDELFTEYGFEDVFYGKTLQQHAVPILHIDNPAMFSDFETNAAFLDKTEQAIRTLFHHRQQLEGYSTLLRHYDTLCHWHLLPLVRGVYRLCRKMLRRNLLGRHPSVGILQYYKLGLYATIAHQHSSTPTL